MIGLAPLLMLGAALIWGLDIAGVAAFLAVLIAVPWLGAYLVWRFGTWAKVVAIVIALLGVAGLFWTAFGLAAPASFFDFVPGLLAVPGAIITIVASVAAIVAGRRGHTVTGREGGERRAINAVVAVVGGLALISAVLTLATRSTTDASDAAAEVDMKDFAYDQAAYQVPGGAQVLVRNEDPFLHTFTIDELGIDVQLGPGSSSLVDIPAEAGTYVVYCTLHTSDPENPTADDMASDLTIE
jgi:plastocyanin